jgi:hypothetical protein
MIRILPDGDTYDDGKDPYPWVMFIVGAIEIAGFFAFMYIGEMNRHQFTVFTFLYLAFCQTSTGIMSVAVHKGRGYTSFSVENYMIAMLGMSMYTLLFLFLWAFNVPPAGV